MRITFFLFTLLFSFFLCSAQQKPKPLYGTPLREKRGFTEGRIISTTDQGGFYVFKHRIRWFIVQNYLFHYNGDLTEIERLRLKKAHTGHTEAVPSRFFKLGEQTLMFSTRRGPRSRLYMYGQSFDGNMSPQRSSPSLGYLDYKKFHASNVSYHLSEDSSSVLVYKVDWRIKGKKKLRNKKRYTFRLLDQKLSTVWEKTFESNLSEPRYLLQNFISRDQKLYSLFEKVTVIEHEKYSRKEIKAPGSVAGKRKHRSKFILQTYDPVSGELKEQKLSEHFELKDKTITTVFMKADESGNVIVCGFYSTDGYEINGAFHMLLDAGQEISEVNTTDFAPSFFPPKKILKKKEIRQKTRAIRGGYEETTFNLIHDVYRTSNGGLSIVAEEFAVGMFSSTRRTSKYLIETVIPIKGLLKDVIVVGFDGKGQVTHTSRVVKEHKSGYGIGFGTFQTISTGSDFYFIFNQNPAKLKEKFGIFGTNWFGGDVMYKIRRQFQPIAVRMDGTSGAIKKFNINNEGSNGKQKCFLYPGYGMSGANIAVLYYRSLPYGRMPVKINYRYGKINMK